ncbi:MAG: YihY/virulence factor BrkB family protein [Anaerolineae bacterium]|nr:YihY/virulence factor BrkB family protein [Anaerolineae bacterium]
MHSFGFKAFLQLVVESLLGWFEHNAILYSASLAYFTLFSLAPLVALSLAIVSLVYNPSEVQSQLIEMAEMIGGDALADQILVLLQQTYASVRRDSIVLSLISLGVLFFGATLVFRQLQTSINAMWGLVPEPVKPQKDNLFKTAFAILRKFLVTVVAAFSVGILLLASLLVTSIGTILLQNNLLGLDLPRWLVPLISFGAVPLVLWLVFACIFKFLPDGRVVWRAVWPGALLTAILFWLGGYAVSTFMALSPASSVYGAASTLFVFLIWVFTSTAIVLFGANFIQLYAKRFSVPITAKAGARLTAPSPPSLELPPQVVKWLE